MDNTLSFAMAGSGQTTHLVEDMDHITLCGLPLFCRVTGQPLKVCKRCQTVERKRFTNLNPAL